MHRGKHDDRAQNHRPWMTGAHARDEAKSRNEKTPLGRQIAKQAGLFVLYTALLAAVGLGVLWLTQPKNAREASDTVFLIGLLVCIVGLLACIMGGPRMFSWFQGRGSGFTREDSTAVHTHSETDLAVLTGFRRIWNTFVMQFRFWRPVPVAAGILLMLCAISLAPRI